MNIMKLKRLFFIAIAASLLLASCQKSEPQKPTEDWDTPVASIGKNNRVIYEVNVRNFSKAGNFDGVRNDIDRLYKLGVDILWLMPIHPIGVTGRSGSLGSPYSVRDYMAVNPDYGTVDDFKNLVNAAHAKGMKVWMDWVPNHTAMDHVWFKEHFTYYAQKSGKPYNPVIGGITWSDVYQLNMKSAEVHNAMIECMKYWVSECKVDGFRFDYASSDMISNDFWVSARAALTAINPDLEFMAEADCSTEYATLLTNFDFDYAWGFNDRMNDFMISKDLNKFKDDCKALFNNDRYQGGKGKMVYVTNHDLNADYGTEFSRFSNFLSIMTAISFTLYDMPLIYNGQEVGDDQQMNLFDKQTVTWGNKNEKIETLIKKLCRLKRTTKALASASERGSLYLMPTENQEEIFSYKRTNGDSEVVVILNFSGKRVDSQFAGTVPMGVFRDYLDGGDVNFSEDPRFSVPAYGVKIYRK